MLSEKQMERSLQKLVRLETTLDGLLFQKVGEVSMKWYHTMERLHEVPADSLFTDCSIGDTWGSKGQYCWFKGTYTPAPELSGKSLYLYPKTGGYETMLWVDGTPYGNYASKIIVGSHGNHYCDLFLQDAQPGKSVSVALEYYAGHYCAGCMPLTDEGTHDFTYTVGAADVCTKDEFISEFLFDLKTLNELVRCLPKDSFRRADVITALLRVHEIVYYAYDDVETDTFYAALREAHPILQAKLARKNSESAPFAGLIGHSHMDTAWLWTIDETIEKCARTYSNQMNLMDQYPEYKFVQSSAYHSEVIRRYYPELFKRIQERVAEGRYEPNGGVWVECDCNIVSGESMVRQFLWGQRFTQKQFGYTADAFWLPDTFGYSPAIPQIMQKSGVRYFLTTKMAWNDTNRFPYDTFYWKGLDGSRVLTHLNKTHIWPSPKSLMEYVVDGKDSGGDCVKEKSVSNMRLLSFGFGDGGGGPEFEMLEMARRVTDLEGLPRSGYTTVSEFMKRLEETVDHPSTYSGELYLELHRGTLTNQHPIKQNNRYAEIALHDLEYVTVRRAMADGKAADSAQIAPLLETLLVNQFHDILPGTCIPEVHKRSIQETGEVIHHARQLTKETVPVTPSADTLTVMNTLSFTRDDVLYLDVPDGRGVALANGGEPLHMQTTDSLLNGRQLAVAGMKLPGFSSCAVTLTDSVSSAGSAFHMEGNVLTTPLLRAVFDENGFLSSLTDLTAGRELRGDGYPLGTLLLAEDVPSAWDNWDVDADLELKFQPAATLLSREIISDGAVEFRVRSCYRLTPKTTLRQDMVFFADSPEIRFETEMDWNDNHRFLKAAFDTAVYTDSARHEVQFGCIKRATNRSTDLEKAKFEVSNQKYTDLSETSYGAAVLNDCKYGISVEEGKLRLSLHKGGTRPDYTGDHGIHTCTYSFLPHIGGFSAQTVVQPAYCLNYKPLVLNGLSEQLPLVEIEGGSILAETVKPCEDGGKSFILRLYECEGSYVNACVRAKEVRQMTETDLLEIALPDAVPGEHELSLSFKPFEIRTIRLDY